MEVSHQNLKGLDSVHTGKLGLRIARNFWGNDKYPDGIVILCELCGQVMKVLSDQHCRHSQPVPVRGAM